MHAKVFIVSKNTYVEKLHQIARIYRCMTELSDSTSQSLKF